MQVIYYNNFYEQSYFEIYVYGMKHTFKPFEALLPMGGNNHYNQLYNYLINKLNVKQDIYIKKILHNVNFNIQIHIEIYDILNQLKLAENIIIHIHSYNNNHNKFIFTPCSFKMLLNNIVKLSFLKKININKNVTDGNILSILRKRKIEYSNEYLIGFDKKVIIYNNFTIEYVNRTNSRCEEVSKKVKISNDFYLENDQEIFNSFLNVVRNEKI